MKILNWIQGWSGQLNSWAWEEWDRLHRKDQEQWGPNYRKWNEEQKKNKKGPQRNDDDMVVCFMGSSPASSCMAV